MTRKKINRVYEDNEEYEEYDEKQEDVEEEVKEPPRISKKTGKPLLSNEEKLKIRRENMAKAIEAKKQKNDITRTLKEKKKELTQIELERQKKELEEIQRQIELKQQIKAKPVKKVVKQIIEEDDEESEPEEQIIVRRKKKPVSVPVVHQGQDDYSQLVKLSAVEQLQKRLENERIRMSLLSIAPNYRF
jgi:hypothetical protein